ncbi:MAG: hypothetical protein IIX44_04810 [Clostridia bacterium]|nr:hypothetical protein [Clostridia bacterium]
MIGLIRHLLNSGDILTFITSWTVFICFAVLILLYGRIKDNRNRLKIWSALCFIPLVYSFVHFFIFAAGGAFLQILPRYLTIYIPAILTAILPLLTKKKMLLRVGTVAFAVICAVCSVLSIYPTKKVNLTRKGLSEAYISLCDYLDENYIMAEWKQIDFEKLKEEGLLLVKDAERTGEIEKYYDAVINLTNSLNDGHAGVFFYNSGSYNYAVEKLTSFNDYGICLITLDDGSTVAINCEDGLAIRDGDVITKWNGIPIAEAIKSVDTPILESVLENDLIQKTFYLAGVGGDSVEVTYIDASGNEAVAVLDKLDSPLPRALSTFSKFSKSKNDYYEYKMIASDIGYLRVTEESTNEISDTIAYYTGNHTPARESFRRDLRELKELGMTKLVIDIRNNAGGYEEVATALVSLFTKEKLYAFSFGIKKGDEMVSVKDRYILPDGEFADLEILVLTGMRCASAGDGLSLYLSRLDNVTVAGTTNPAGINQETGGVIYLPENIAVSFPTGLILDGDGNPNIDTDHTRESRNPVDIKIPLDKNAVIKIFSGIDYELEWAIEYLN